MTELKNTGRAWQMGGLAIALLGIPGVMFAYRFAVGDISTIGQMLSREIAIFILLGALLWIIKRGERRPLSSIGLRRGGTGRSLLWGVAAFILLGLGTAAALGLLQVLGLSYGGDRAFVPPLWLTALVVIRAGVVEEVFYRGYAMERIEALTGSRTIAALLPLIAFASFHYRHGVAGILVALILGAVLTGFYLWRRDLKANIAGHFLIDFVPNLLLPLLLH